MNNNILQTRQALQNNHQTQIQQIPIQSSYKIKKRILLVYLIIVISLIIPIIVYLIDYYKPTIKILKTQQFTLQNKLISIKQQFQFQIINYPFKENEVFVVQIQKFYNYNDQKLRNLKITNQTQFQKDEIIKCIVLQQKQYDFKLKYCQGKDFQILWNKKILKSKFGISEMKIEQVLSQFAEFKNKKMHKVLMIILQTGQMKKKVQMQRRLDKQIQSPNSQSLTQSNNKNIKQSFKNKLVKYISIGKKVLQSLGILKKNKNNKFNNLGSMIPNYCYHTIQQWNAPTQNSQVKTYKFNCNQQIILNQKNRNIAYILNDDFLIYQ